MFQCFVKNDKKIDEIKLATISYKKKKKHSLFDLPEDLVYQK